MNYVVLSRASWRKATEYAQVHARGSFKTWAAAQTGRLLAMGYGHGTKKGVGFDMPNTDDVVWLDPRSSVDGLPWFVGPVQDNSITGTIQRKMTQAFGEVTRRVMADLLKDVADDKSTVDRDTSG